MEYNEYDKEAFFNQYKQMSRSTDGLKGAGEWHELQKLLPDFSGKDVLDLGCGFGWHCKYAVDREARRALGIDPGVHGHGVGHHAGLPPGEGHHRESQRLHGHGAEGHGNLFPGGQKHVHLARGRAGIDLPGLLNQFVGGVALSAQHGHHLVSRLIGIRDNLRYMAQAAAIRYGSAAEFLYNQAHESVPLSLSV